MSQRIAVVTGASAGLGLASCRALAKKGHRVVLTARTQEKAAAAADSLVAEGFDVEAAELDVASDASVQAFVDGTLAKLGRIDVLINNAATIFDSKSRIGTSSTLEVPAAVLAEAFNNNTLGAYRLMQAVLPVMNRQKYGRVVNISSGMGALTDMGSGHPAYRVSKAALNAITVLFHREAGPNVKVNAVCPGWVRTDMGGPDATRSIEESIPGIVWAATLDEQGPGGGFFRDQKPIAW